MEYIMFGLGPMELILILVIVIVLFGAKRLPAIGEGLALLILMRRKKNLKNTLHTNKACQI